MTDDAALQRQFRAACDREPVTRDGCPEVADLEAAAQRSDAETARLVVLEHLATCASCRREFDLLRTVAETKPASSTRWLRWGAAAAALAAAFLLLVWRGAPPRPDASFRGPAAGISLREPTIDVDSVRFSWHPVAGATRYVVEVIGPDGSSAASLEATDTVATIPLTVLRPGDGYRWSVQASLRDGGTVDSPLDSLRFTR